VKGAELDQRCFHSQPFPTGYKPFRSASTSRSVANGDGRSGPNFSDGHAAHVGVDERNILLEGEAGDRARGVGADARKTSQSLRVGWPAAALDDRLRRALQVHRRRL
jgi:hypothetical protein